MVERDDSDGVDMAGELRRRLAWTALLRVFKPGTPGLGKRLAALPRMITATMRGEYDGGARLRHDGRGRRVTSSRRSTSSPRRLPAVLGLVDDAAMVAWLAGALLAETERFLEWERDRARRSPVTPFRPRPGRPTRAVDRPEGVRRR